MPKKKHAKHMTTEEAVKHLFHPHVVRHVKTEIQIHDNKKGATRDKRNKDTGRDN